MRKTKFKYLAVALIVIVLCLGASFTAAAMATPRYVPAKKTYVKSSCKKQVIIYVGDSRVMYATCGYYKTSARKNFAMCFVNGGNASVIDIETGSLTSKLKRYIRKYRSRKPVVVFNLGLNGNSIPKSNAKRIIRIYKEWMEAYPDITFYVESIGPTILTSGPYGDPGVVELNEYLKAEFEPMGIWIDTYKYINNKKLIDSSGKGLRDDYHFDWMTSRKILLYLRRHIKADLAAKAAAVSSASA